MPGQIEPPDVVLANFTPICAIGASAGGVGALQQTPEEAKELFSDLLISVTMFFHDARASEALDRLVAGPIIGE